MNVELSFLPLHHLYSLVLNQNLKSLTSPPSLPFSLNDRYRGVEAKRGKRLQSRAFVTTHKPNVDQVGRKGGRKK